LLASGFSPDIAEKSRVKEVAEMAGTLALGLALAPPDDEPLLPHAAATRPSAQIPAVVANLVATGCKETLLVARQTPLSSRKEPPG
jgi:hypothetical protein